MQHSIVSSFSTRIGILISHSKSDQSNSFYLQQQTTCFRLFLLLTEKKSLQCFKTPRKPGDIDKEDIAERQSNVFVYPKKSLGHLLFCFAFALLFPKKYAGSRHLTPKRSETMNFINGAWKRH